MPELNFKGKEFVYNHHLTVPFRPLVPDADKGIGEPALDGNLIIHGDNLHGLKALLPTHAGKVDCIFIDPPYNTGNEGWCYNDNVNSPMIKEWLSDNPIGLDDGLRHDKWACMMWPRLRLLHELLSENGSLWMTLDDNEAQRGKLILDEIFGDAGFVANVVWQKKYSVANDHTGIAPMHDHMLVYRKSEWSRNLLERAEGNDSQYRHEDGGGIFRVSDYTCNKNSDERPNLYYPVINQNTGEEIWPKKTAVWRYTRERHSQNEAENLVWWGRDGKASTPGFKRYRHKLKGGGGVVPGTWWNWEFASHTDAAKKELRAILPDILPEDSTITPKPVTLIERVIQIATDKDALILDSFAGSGTTAHAVLAANARDGGKRHFILVEGEDYADRLTAERARRVIKGYAFKGTQKDELLREPLTFTKLRNAATLMERVQGIETLDGPKYDRIAKTVKDGALIVTGERDVEERTEGLGGTFTYCTLGDPIDMDGLLTGEDLPAVEGLAALLYHTATSQAFDQSSLTAEPTIGDGVMRLGDANGRHLWLIYKPDLEWLKSAEAALTLSRARAIAATEAGDHLVFAPAKFVSRELLTQERLAVEYAPLPFALYRVETA
ncbi:MAG: site-specific DNA-methyltransferase [Sphingobium sp.]